MSSFNNGLKLNLIGVGKFGFVSEVMADNKELVNKL